MINLHDDDMTKNISHRCQRGAAVLAFTLVLMLLCLLIIIFAGNYANLQSKSIANLTRSQQALNAAIAGSEYAIAYLQTNSSTVTASPVGGYINYSIATVTLANNATYSVVITNPTANNYTLLNIKSTGVSDDGTATRVIQQQVNSGGSSLQYAVTSQGSMVASGTGNVTGTTNALDLGGTFTHSGSWNIPGSEIKQNDTNISSMSAASFFNYIFNESSATFQSQSTVYSSTSGIPWSSLSGKVYINTSVVQSGNITVGSAANPVILVVNGSWISSGTATIYGIIYTTGGIITSGNFNVNGAMVSQGQITMSGSVATYSSTIVNKLMGAGYFARVSGSWKDF